MNIPEVGTQVVYQGVVIRRPYRTVFWVDFDPPVKVSDHNSREMERCWVRAQNVVNAALGLPLVELTCLRCGQPGRKPGHTMCAACLEQSKRGYDKRQTHAAKYPRPKRAITVRPATVKPTPAPKRAESVELFAPHKLEPWRSSFERIDFLIRLREIEEQTHGTAKHRP